MADSVGLNSRSVKRTGSGDARRAGHVRLPAPWPETSSRCSRPRPWPSWAPRTIPAKWGNWLARGALPGAHRRPVYLVNRNGGRVLGGRDVPSLAEPARGARAGGGRGAGGRLRAGGRRRAGRRRAGRLSASRPGWARRGGEAAARERALVERVRAAGAMLLGPNCLGVFDASSRARPCLQRVSARLDRADLPERQPGARAGHAGRGRTGSASRASPRSATRPTSTWPSWSPPTPATSRPADRRLRRGLSRRPGVRRRRRRLPASRCVLLTVGCSDASARAAASHTGALVSRRPWSRPPAAPPGRTWCARRPS